MRNISGEVVPSETMEGSEAENSDKIVITDSDLVPLEELDTSEEVVGPVLAKVILSSSSSRGILPACVWRC